MRTNSVSPRFGATLTCDYTSFKKPGPLADTVKRNLGNIQALGDANTEVRIWQNNVQGFDIENASLFINGEEVGTKFQRGRDDWSKFIPNVLAAFKERYVGYTAGLKAGQQQAAATTPPATTGAAPATT